MADSEAPLPCMRLSSFLILLGYSFSKAETPSISLREFPQLLLKEYADSG
jgi:hypothetical protein